MTQMEVGADGVAVITIIHPPVNSLSIDGMTAFWFMTICWLEIQLCSYFLLSLAEVLGVLYFSDGFFWLSSVSGFQNVTSIFFFPRCFCFLATIWRIVHPVLPSILSLLYCCFWPESLSLSPPTIPDSIQRRWISQLCPSMVLLSSPFTWSGYVKRGIPENV